jgi:hypothetical protein
VLKNIENVEDKENPVNRDENEVDDGNGRPDSHGGGGDVGGGLRSGGDDGREGSGTTSPLNIELHGPFLSFRHMRAWASSPARDGSPSKQKSNLTGENKEKSKPNRGAASSYSQADSMPRTLGFAMTPGAVVLPLYLAKKSVFRQHGGGKGKLADKV